MPQQKIFVGQDIGWGKVAVSATGVSNYWGSR